MCVAIAALDFMVLVRRIFRDFFWIMEKDEVNKYDTCSLVKEKLKA